MAWEVWHICTYTDSMILCSACSFVQNGPSLRQPAWLGKPWGWAWYVICACVYITQVTCWNTYIMPCMMYVGMHIEQLPYMEWAVYTEHVNRQ